MKTDTIIKARDIAEKIGATIEVSGDIIKLEMAGGSYTYDLSIMDSPLFVAASANFVAESSSNKNAILNHIVNTMFYGLMSSVVKTLESKYF